MKILYLGYLLPEEDYKNNKALSFAAGRFERGFINSLSKYAGVETITIEPALKRFPKGKFWIKKREELSLIDRKTKSKSLGYINFPFLKHICLYAGMWRNIQKWKKKYPEETKAIISYNADVPIIQIGLRAERGGVHYIPILADIPYYDDVEGQENTSLARKLSKIGYESQYKNLPRLKQAVVLNKNVAEDFCLPKYLLIEGAITEAETQSGIICSSIAERKNVFYCGLLGPFHGTDSLIEAAKELPNVSFMICGRGESPAYTSVVKKADKELKNFHYFGEVDNKRLRELQTEADLMVIPHPIGLRQLKYQFPSKLMTCMATGVPVLMTKLPGLPDEYTKYVSFIDGDSGNSIAKGIREFFSIELEKRLQMGRNARDFVLKNKTWDTQAERIIKFVESI